MVGDPGEAEGEGEGASGSGRQAASFMEVRAAESFCIRNET